MASGSKTKDDIVGTLHEYLQNASVAVEAMAKLKGVSMQEILFDVFGKKMVIGAYTEPKPSPGLKRKESVSVPDEDIYKFVRQENRVGADQLAARFGFTRNSASKRLKKMFEDGKLNRHDEVKPHEFSLKRKLQAVA